MNFTPRRCVIIESPYAGDVYENVKYARRAVHNSLMRGEAPFASHIFYTQPGILNDLDPNERSLGIACGIAWQRRASYSAFYTDKGWSPGMLAALHDHNLKENIPFRLRAMFGPVKLPATLDEDLETLLRSYIEE